MISPIPIHPDWFDEKSGGAACAAAAKASVQAAPAKMPPRRILLIKNVDMMPLLGSFPRCPRLPANSPANGRIQEAHYRDMCLDPIILALPRKAGTPRIRKSATRDP